MFLGLVGVPAPIYSPEAFSALRAGGTALGAAAEAASQVAIGGILAQGAAVLGAGALGFIIGQQLLKNLEYTGLPPTASQVYKTPSNIGMIRVTAVSKIRGQQEQPYDNTFPSPVVIPVSDDLGNNIIRYGALVGANATLVGYLSADRSLIEIPLTVTTIQKVNGTPIEDLRKVPGFPQLYPNAPFKIPTTIPIAPGIDPYPITPEIVPYDPPADPDREQARVPGVTVKIPELGLEFDFTPNGVAIKSYTAPDTKPFETPDITKLPGSKKPSQLDCCEPPKDKRPDEILCRIKTLQKKVLDDGYQDVATFFGASQCSLVTGLTTGFYKLSINVVSTPINSYPEQYPAPAAPVNYCGWYSWMIDGTPSDRLPISFLSSTYYPPQGATGYMVGLKNGYQASTAYYTRTKKDYVDLC